MKFDTPGMERETVERKERERREREREKTKSVFSLIPLNTHHSKSLNVPNSQVRVCEGETGKGGEREGGGRERKERKKKKRLYEKGGCHEQPKGGKKWLGRGKRALGGYQHSFYHIVSRHLRLNLQDDTTCTGAYHCLIRERKGVRS